MNESREKLGSRLGFILLSAGCAIGVGNVWKFPWMTGQYGGGAFVLIYLIFLVILGLPVMTMEFSIGRAAQKSPLFMYQQMEPKGTKWHYHGIACLVGNVVLMMFYTVVAGWILYYCVKFASGTMVGLTSEEVTNVFYDILGRPGKQIGYMAAIVILTFLVLSLGLNKGLEKVGKFMMAALMVLMLVLAIRSGTLSGAKEGLTFYLKPELSNVSGQTIVAAMNQAFFTLSLGIGAMAIFGSYIDKERSLMGESITIILLDTFVALVAGFIIFPGCATYNIATDSGPGLLFVVMANVFSNMNGGSFWGALFFLFMTFAAFSTVLAVCENIMVCVREQFGWSRKKSCLVCAVGIFILSIPCALGYNVWSGVHPIGSMHDIQESEDFIVSNCLLPLGALFMTVFCTQKKGWGWEKFRDEANTGKGVKVQDWMRSYCTWAIPVIILVIFVIGVLDYFKLL